MDEVEALMGNKDGFSKNDYMLMHKRCAVCHWPVERPGRWLELHHIVGGSGRKDPPDGSNWLAICNRCHHFTHHVSSDKGGLPPGALLSAKEEEDGSVDPGKLASLKGKKGLSYDQCEIPQKFLDDRRKRGGDPWP